MNDRLSQHIKTPAICQKGQLLLIKETLHCSATSEANIFFSIMSLREVSAFFKALRGKNSNRFAGLFQSSQM